MHVLAHKVARKQYRLRARMEFIGLWDDAGRRRGIALAHDAGLRDHALSPLVVNAIQFILVRQVPIATECHGPVYRFASAGCHARSVVPATLANTPWWSTATQAP